MSKIPQQITLPEAHHYFASECIETAIGLLSQPGRTDEQNQMLETIAQAGYFHNLQGKDKTALVRCLWLLAKVYATLRNSAKSIYFASKCRTESGDFEEGNALSFAYACDAMGRAYDASQQPEQAHGYLQLALDVADSMSNANENSQFLTDFELGCYESGNEMN